MKALLVGAGAVGQVFAAHLASAGWEIGLLVKPRYARAARAGFTLLPPGEEPWSWTPPVVLEDPVEAARERWDQVWLCVSSTALVDAWLDALARATPEATWVTLQPGLEDRALLLRYVPPSRLVSGLIGFSAWGAPLPGQEGPKGLGYWFPPGVPCRFSGPEPAVDAIVDALARAGLPASASADAARDGALGSALLNPTMAALEVAGWTFSAWRHDPVSRLGAAAAREALAVAGATHEVATWPLALLARRRVFSLVLRLAPMLAPMPLETFFRVHFGKVGDQTRAMLATWIRVGEARGLRVDALRALLGRMPPR